MGNAPHYIGELRDFVRCKGGGGALKCTGIFFFHFILFLRRSREKGQFDGIGGRRRLPLSLSMPLACVETIKIAAIANKLLFFGRAIQYKTCRPRFNKINFERI